MNIITSKANNVVKNTKKLLQKKYRKDSYLIEGWHLFEEAVNAQAEIRHIFVLENFFDKVKDFSQVHVVTSEILTDLADSKTPQGIVAEIAFEKQSAPSFLKGKYLFLEDVQDPGNVGTIIRTADAAGYDGVFISQHSADIYNLKTLRSMQGSHFHLPIYQMKTSDFLKLAKQAQLPILATTLSKDSIDYREVAPISDFVLVMGNEGQGISQQMMDEADQLVHISMKGQAESLNVAVAAGILIFSLS
ncbi:TrmH family RNA methyltransferase [Streptococcus constellatus]|uniref:TrmH family RNA methyltransferase n=1 Tax=Streptococcus constellatus TaxID=76860 RepID=UPI0012392649|nr:RNA methyltransferase [Streptococcus constellatus]